MPCSQCVQCVEYCGELCPAGHIWQLADPTLPRLLLNRPAAQATHRHSRAGESCTPAASSTPYLPLSHGLQNCCPFCPRVFCPAAHVAHWTAPGCTPNRPLAQVSQELAPDFIAYLPAGQRWQAAEPTLEVKCPASHSAHSFMSRAPWNRPAGQRTHVAPPPPSALCSPGEHVVVANIGAMEASKNNLEVA